MKASRFRRTLMRKMLSLKKEYRNGLIPTRRVIDGVEVAPYKGDAKAAVSISADFELNWAWRGRLSREKTEEKGQLERDNVPLVLQILNEYKVSITWATVGHLFLDSCKRGRGGLAHPEMPRPLKNDFWNGDWYMHDPCTNYRRDPHWYCPDLIQQIVESNVCHEIGTHSFSHINCLPSHATEDLVGSEIDYSRAAMSRFGIKPRSMVFPNNKLGHLDVLSSNGIIGVRKRDPSAVLSYPVRSDEGVYQVIETLSLGKPRFCRFVDKARALLDLAIRRNAVFSIWFHPSASRAILTGEFRETIMEISRKKEQGTVWVATIEELAAYSEAREKINFEVTRKDERLTVMIRSDFNQERYGRPRVTLVAKVPARPRVILIEECGELREERNYIFRKEKGEGKVIVDVPILAKLVHVLF